MATEEKRRDLLVDEAGGDTRLTLVEGPNLAFVALVINGLECIRFRRAPTKDILIAGPIIGDESEVSTTDNTITTIATIPIADDTAVAFEVNGEGVRTNGADQAAYIRRALVFRRGGGPATIQGAVSNEWTEESAPAWNFTIAVTGNDCIITVRGSISHDIDWFASVVKRERPL